MTARAPRPPRRSGAAVVAALALAGCGSAGVAELPPPAGPREAPLMAAAPEGRLVARAAAPAAVAAGLAAQATSVAVERGRRAVVRPRERVVELTDGRGGREVATAGVGPTRAAADDRWLWVTDTQGDALLVFRTRPKLELVRRVYLPGGPYAIAFDSERLRLWVTLTATNELVELPAHGRPRELERFATVRGPEGVAVDPASGGIYVAGAEEELQLLDPSPGS